MNIYTIMIALAIFSGSVVGSYFTGRSDGINLEKGRRVDIEVAQKETFDLAMMGAAQAISNIKITNTTIQGEVRREVIEKPVYRDCVHGVDVMQLIQAALAGNVVSAGDSKLP